MSFLGLMFGWAKSNWQTVAVGLVIVAVSIYIGVLKLEVSHANNKVAALTAENASLGEQVKNYAFAYHSIAEKVLIQNKAVDDLKARSDKAKRASQEAIKKASDNYKYQQTIIDALKAGSREKLTCSDAVKAAKGDLLR